MKKRLNPSRRDVLKMAAMAGGAAALAPLLKACANVTPRTATAAASATPASTDVPEDLLGDLRALNIDEFFQEAYRRWMQRDPENLTILGLADLYGAGDANLTDVSEGFLRDTQALESGMLELLRGYDRSKLSTTQAVTADEFDWFLDDLVRGHPFMYDDYPVSPAVTSIPYNLYMLFTVYHPLNNRQDAEDFISRLSQVGTKFDALIEGLRKREAQGVILPGFLFGYVTQDIDRLAGGSVSAHDYVTAFARRLTGVTEDERTELIAETQRHVEQAVMPAYGRLSEFLHDEQSRARNAIGVWQFADGEAYYQQCLRRHTTTDMTADEIHELGKQNLERIQEEMRPLFAALGYSATESIPRLFDRLTQDSGVYNGDAAVGAYEEAIGIAQGLLPRAFHTAPRVGVEVVGGRDGDYYVPASFDGSRPGLFFARTDAGTPRFGVKTTGFHETIPGHHFQTALAAEVPGLPELRRGMQFNAYTEGWALYAERLMAELGAYEDDPQSDLGRLRMEAFRAARLVVDTGIHSKQWGFQQAVDYLIGAAGFPSGFAQSEISRYCVWPGQATSYYIGFLKLIELREKARQALGAKFDIKAFHDVVLTNGSVPLTVLERLIDGYMQASA